ncbi:hypothetical protein B5K06_13105 [Rhizobium grahamii]|uniref:Uncharacterized protein n=1 Tax=Rhizobium grahamii TaxID=1120045 RepID=A0A370KPG5_9HYPH|nr:hypothetical protein B5K06_13105 [Rhizobium grahamii]
MNLITGRRQHLRAFTKGQTVVIRGESGDRRRKQAPSRLGSPARGRGTDFGGHCAAKFAAKIGIASEPANLSDIAHRLSAVLIQLTTAGRVRQSG